MSHTISFDHFTESLGIIPVTAVVEREGVSFNVIEIDACDHDGGELSPSIMAAIEEKVLSKAHDLAIDALSDYHDRAEERAEQRLHLSPGMRDL